MAGTVHPVILVDGECALCHRFARFVAKRDPRALFRFGTLQSEAGRLLLQQAGLPDDTSTVVVIEAGHAHTRSTAAGHVLRRLRFPWNCVGAMMLLLPRPMRDLAYRMVAKHRYRILGRTQSCGLPAGDWPTRLID